MSNESDNRMKAEQLAEELLNQARLHLESEPHEAFVVSIEKFIETTISPLEKLIQELTEDLQERNRKIASLQLRPASNSGIVGRFIREACPAATSPHH